MTCRIPLLPLSAMLLVAALGACSAPLHRPAASGGFFVGDHESSTARIAGTDGVPAAEGSGHAGPADETEAAKPVDDPDALPEPTTIRQAIEQGRAYLKIRIREENVHQTGIDKNANAVTVRSVLGYETAAIYGFSALAEVENISRLGPETYNDTYNGKTNRPVIADPTDTEVNQAYLQYVYEDTTVRGGRQRITLDNQRFIGNVGWRQNEQTFDGFGVKTKAGPVDVYTAWLSNANRIFGDDSPMGDARMSSWLVNAKAPLFEQSALTGYWYYLDFRENSGLAGTSTSTVGGRFESAFGGEDFKPVKLLVEYASQSDVGDNPGRVAQDYSHFKVSGEAGPVQLAVGHETLGGSQGDSGAFSTPLATLHKFNGWADKFLTTPATGLKDTYVSVGGKAWGTKLQAVYHDFQSDASSADYGQELDLAAIRPIDEKSSWGAKYANYDADDFSRDTNKFWLWYETSF